MLLATSLEVFFVQSIALNWNLTLCGLLFDIADSLNLRYSSLTFVSENHTMEKTVRYIVGVPGVYSNPASIKETIS